MADSEQEEWARAAGFVDAYDAEWNGGLPVAGLPGRPSPRVLPADADLDAEFIRLYPPGRVTVSPWAGHARAWVRDGNPDDLTAMLAADLPTWEEQADVLGRGEVMPGPAPAEAWNWMRMEQQPQSWWTSPMGPVFRTVLALGVLVNFCVLAWAVAGSWLAPALVAAVVIYWCAAKRRWPWHRCVESCAHRNPGGR